MSRRRWIAPALGCWLIAGGAAADEVIENCRAAAGQGGVDECERAVLAHPGNAAVIGDYALALLVAGRYEASIDAYRHVTELAPGEAKSHFDYAAALVTLRQFPPAVGAIEAALRLEPRNREAQMLANLIFDFLGRREEAFAAAHNAAELGDVTAMYEVQRAYADGDGARRDDARAFAWLQRAAEAGHVGAMQDLAAVFRHGILGQAPDEAAARAWAERADQAQAQTD